MEFFSQLWNRLTGHSDAGKPKRVALVLGGGGARGLAHLGAIEALLEQGFQITSVAGTSMGALVGGLLAAGKFNEAKSMAEQLTRKRVLRMMDISPGLDHIATGDRFMQILEQLVGDTQIEDLHIPFCCSASDLVSGKEVVFRSGPLTTAIRASVSIPGFFKPVTLGNQILVDGSLHNPLPLDRVQRHPGDLLIAVNVTAPDNSQEAFNADSSGNSPNPFNINTADNLQASTSVTATDNSQVPASKSSSKDKPSDASPRQPAAAIGNSPSSFWQRLPLFRAFLKTELSSNYLNMALRVVQLSIQNNTQTSIRLTPPDLCLNLPMSSFSLFDFDKAPEIIHQGYLQMLRLLSSRFPAHPLS